MLLLFVLNDPISLISDCLSLYTIFLTMSLMPIQCPHLSLHRLLFFAFLISSHEFFICYRIPHGAYFTFLFLYISLLFSLFLLCSHNTPLCSPCIFVCLNLKLSMSSSSPALLSQYSASRRSRITRLLLPFCWNSFWFLSSESRFCCLYLDFCYLPAPSISPLYPSLLVTIFCEKEKGNAWG